MISSKIYFNNLFHATLKFGVVKKKNSTFIVLGRYFELLNNFIFKIVIYR